MEAKKTDLPIGAKAAIFAGAALPVLPIDVLAHWGVTGLALGGFGAFAMAKESPQIYEALKAALPFLPDLSSARTSGKRTIWDRLTNHYPVQRDQEEAQPHEDEIEPLQPRPQDFDAEDELAAPTLAPTGPLYFSEVLKTFKPSLDKIYMGTLPDGKMIFIQARDLCHTALAGATRGGKDHLIRQLMSQLCYAGAKCYLLDPNYTRYDRESRDPFGRPCPEDWTPFDAWLKNDPQSLIPVSYKYQVIEHYLKASYDLVNQRMEARGHAQKLGAPQFLFINEIPAIVEEIPHAATYLKKILREGAKLDVFMVNASQDFQVATVFKDVGGGIRECYRTVFDVGSDPATQRALGLPPVASGLGKGRASLRCDGVTSSVRVPYVDNQALYSLLGPSTYVPTREARANEQEDELVSYMVSGREQGQPSAPETRYHSHATGRASVQSRTREREQRLRGTGPSPIVQRQEETPENRLSDDDRHVLDAYRDGKRSGGAINAATHVPFNRINASLHRLAGAGLIDWQPRK